MPREGVETWPAVGREKTGSLTRRSRSRKKNLFSARVGRGAAGYVFRFSLSRAVVVSTARGALLVNQKLDMQSSMWCITICGKAQPPARRLSISINIRRGIIVPPVRCCLWRSFPAYAKQVFGASLALLLLISPGNGQDPGTVGQWSAVMTWPYTEVHAHVLPTGKVLFWPAFSQGDNPQLWDPTTNVVTAGPKAGANIFCSGHAFLPDGRLLVAGGHGGFNYVGIPNAYIYDPFSNPGPACLI